MNFQVLEISKAVSEIFKGMEGKDLRKGFQTLPAHQSFRYKKHGNTPHSSQRIQMMAAVLLNLGKAEQQTRN